MMVFRYKVTAALNKPELDKFVTVQFGLLSINKDEITGQSKSSFQLMKTAPCAELIAQGKMRSITYSSQAEKDFILDGGVCVDPENADMVIGRTSAKDAYFQRVAWRVMPCRVPTGCVPKEELSKVTFATLVPRAVQDLGNKKNPVRYSSSTEEVQYLSSAFTLRQNINLLKSEIFDEAGFLFGDKLVKSFTTVASVGFGSSDRPSNMLSCTQKQVDDITCVPYFIQSFMGGPQKMVIKRQYKGLVETFSEVGGMADMLFTVFLLLHSVYSGRALRQQLLELIYGVKKPQKRKHLDNAVASQATGSRAQQDFVQDRARYSSLLERAESCLDIVKLTKEIEAIKHILGISQGGPFQAPEASLMPRGPITPNTEELFPHQSNKSIVADEKETKIAILGSSGRINNHFQTRSPLGRVQKSSELPFRRFSNASPHPTRSKQLNWSRADNSPSQLNLQPTDSLQNQLESFKLSLAAEKGLGQQPNFAPLSLAGEEQ